MKRLFALALAAPLGAAGLFLAGCDTQAQQEVKEQAEAIDESYEAQADLTEAVALGSPNEAVAEQRADALREQGDKAKDHLESMAKELDDVPKK